LNILRGRGEYSIALPQIWRDRGETKPDDILVDHLNKEQFIVHTLLHSSRHLTDEGFTEIKWLIDLLYSIKAWKIGWSKVWNISRKWGIEKDILPVAATLNHYWQTDIPLPGTPEPIALNILVSGVKDRQKQYYANIPTSYLGRLFKIRELPDTASQIRYIFHLFFPTPENLRFRYGLSEKSLITPYYLLHLFVTLKKVFLGLWYRVLYHPQ